MNSGVLTKDIIISTNLARAIGVGFFIFATTMGAFIRIPLPFTPVPITMQTFFVLLAGAVLGSTLGSISQLGYILAGVSGISVFASGGFGLIYLAGPTGGYLFGFIAAAYLAGKLLRLREKPSFSWIVFCLIIADAALFIFGITHLAIFGKLSFITSLKLGLLPFIPGEIFKISLASIIVSYRVKPRS